LVCLCLLAALTAGAEQKKPAAVTPDDTRRVLVEKARAMEARGRPDMAIQLWQQILLSDPKNTEALAGIARDYKLSGSSDKAADALDQLRRVNPNDPNIAKIAAMASTQAQSGKMRQAGELARQGKLDDAMRIYRELYGDRPPDGDIALAYYQTLYGTASGKEEAIKQMRALAQRNPSDTRFAIELGVMLTYEARTRAEGIKILREHPQDAIAEAALRQALIWDAANPGTAAQLRQYLKEHPRDQEIAKHLKEDDAKLAQMNSGIARTPEERLAFAALNAHHLEEAQTRFTALLEKEPKNGRVLAGMGFLRMQQNNFGGAISFLTDAEQNGYKDRTIETALATSRFWFTMGEATQLFEDNQLDAAMEKYRAALAMRPRSPEALVGIAGLLVKEGKFPGAIGSYEELVKLQPKSAEAWRGLFLSYARENENQKALAVSGRFPPAVRADLLKDPEYLRTLATIYQAMNRTEEARKTLALALSLPFPEHGGALKIDTKLQYAGILMEAKRYDQASTLFVEILDEDMGNLPAWEGLISAHHEMGKDTEAIADVQRMPPAVYEAALGNPGFLDMLAGIYQESNQFEVAQGLLERSVKLTTEAGGQPTLAVQLQLAAIYLKQNDTEKSYALYRQILNTHAESVLAWKGLISSLLATDRHAEALQEMAQIPAPVRKQLENDIDFIQGEASAYASTGDTQHAIETMNRVLAHYAGAKIEPPAKIAIQNAWLLYNTRNDRGLYGALMQLGVRKDLTLPQRETVQTIWANWAVRRAETAMENDNIRRAVDILESAAAAFPENLTVRKAVAGGYARVGRAKEALALFRAVPMQDASAGDFQGAIDAALAARDRTQAEIWLRQAMERYPRDPAILQLAARYEQARGDSQRAADFYRASLAVMPKTSPANRLAHVLVYPEQDERTRKASTPADLERILDPSYEPFSRTIKAGPLPAYGTDPYNAAPVVLDETRSGVQVEAMSAEWASAPSLPPAQVDAGEIAAATAGTQQPVQQAGKSDRPDQSAYMGAMHLPSAEKKIAAPEQAVAASAQQEEAPARETPVERERAAQDAILAPQVHSLAGDAWKGLIFSLLSANKATEALQQIAVIPPDIRTQLEGDVEFEQAEASLYALVGDHARSNEYTVRVENYYLLRHMQPPANFAVQIAWQLYNTRNDERLYRALTNLDARHDLTPELRAQVETIWADWSARRALAELDNGHFQRALMLLDAAMVEFPGNPNVRMAVAGGYVRLGRAQEAMAIFKAEPLQNASANDMQGAISAAVAANDLAQAEIWLRQALASYPNDPGVLSAAARYEQARGNSLRAADYWREAIKNLPAGSSMQKFDTVTGGDGVYVNRPTPAQGDLKKLLAPGSYRPNISVPLPAPTPKTPSSYTSTRPEQLHQQNAPMEGVSLLNQGAASQWRLRTVSNVVIDDQQAAGDSSSENGGTAGLRISAQPMNRVAARAQALLAEETDSQLTQGSANAIHALPVVEVKSTLPAESSTPKNALPVAPATAPAASGEAHYAMAQYTPSAQDATTGAYSVPQQPAPQQPQPAPVQPPMKPSASTPVQEQTPQPVKHRKHKKKEQTETAAQQPAATPTLQQAPAAPPADQIQVTDLPGAPTPVSTRGLTDEELEQRNLPPLRGPWVRVQREKRELSPREEAELQLSAIESSYSGWLGGNGYVNYRSGALGYDQLAAMEAPFEVSMPLGYAARLTIVAKPVFLDSGQADGNATMTVQEQTTSGTQLLSIPEPIGTLVPSATNLITVPAQQNAAGLGGEVQLAFKNFAIAGGYTPAGFLVATETGRLFWKPGNGPITFTASRDSVKDTQLSYAGLRDPSGDTLGSEGQIWGGVVANEGHVQYTHGDAQSGFYLGAGGQYLTGYSVVNNQRIDGNGGAYWRVLSLPEYGNLTIGANFFGMHYKNNEDAFTHGMGGYFSPQAYFLGNAPISWTGHYGGRWHYNLMGSLGIQGFNEAKTLLWPLAVDSAEEIANNNAALPAKTSVGANYDLRTNLAYQIGPHWFVGGFVNANNSRNYSSVSAGFSVRFLFRSQPATAAGPTGNFPADGMRPFNVP
jgi:tetratricopeptide (TPR) repeat protein